MKFLQVILITLSLLLLVPFLVVESSSLSDNNLASNITRGSSLSSNDTSPYWLSPSGNLAFGFYLLPCTRSSSPNCPDRYVVGIWFVKSPRQTLVWTANPNDLPLHKPSSILFTNDGKLMLRIMPDNKDKPLISDMQEPASYAKMHDDGNFVLYGSDSQIVWESFDYPTDTILGGQKLKAGIDLISGNHRLSVRQTDGLVAISYAGVVSDEIGGGSVSAPVTMNLDTTGNLYLVGSDDVVLKYLYRNKNHEPKQLQENGSIGEELDGYLYRATLDSEGGFQLFKERIDGNISTSTNYDEEKSYSTLVLLWKAVLVDDVLEVFVWLYFVIMGVLLLVLLVCSRAVEKCKECKDDDKKRSGGGDLELGKILDSYHFVENR